jgi:hypothetical protein
VKYAAKIAAIIVIVGTLAACSGAPKDLQLAEQCESGLIVAYDELNFAEAKGFGGTVDWTKAAGLLTGASFQKEFGKYPNCVDKVRRARYYIEHSQK